MIKMFKLKKELQLFVFEHRVGKHSLRPFGSNAPTSSKSQSLGSRLKVETTEPTIQQPLNRVFYRIKVWFDEERRHNSEVRSKHIIQQAKYELEYEADKQRAFQQHSDKMFIQAVLDSANQKLAFLKVHGESRQQDEFMQKRVYPAIGASAIQSQYKHCKPLHLDGKKFELTVDSVDYIIQIVATGTFEQLQHLVADPAEFIIHRKKTVLLVLDETPLWLKLRGEEKVLRSFAEVLQQSKKSGVRASIKRSSNAEEMAQAEADLQAWIEEVQAAGYAETNENIAQFYASGGDKHRLTLINISQVRHWWDPELDPVPGKDIVVLLVFCEHYIKLEDIDDDHKFNKEVSYETSSGWVIFEKGQSTKCLWSYVEMRKKTKDPAVFQKMRIWGQVKAWVDTQICCQLSDLLFEIYGQNVVICDCLGARWSPASMLGHWANQSILCPLAPESTPFMAEPDTHEHSQMKAAIREVKSDLHFDLEMEAKNKNKDITLFKWGPNEYVYIVAKGIDKFMVKNPQVPLQGMISNQVLATRPTMDQNGNISVKLLEDCSEQSTRDLLQVHKLSRYPPARGISLEWALLRDARVRAWPEHKAPQPNWDTLRMTNAPIFQDDMPSQPGPDDIVFSEDLEHLELTDHQKLLLLPVEMRMKNLVYPAAVTERIASIKTLKVLSKRKDRWGSKLHGHFKMDKFKHNLVKKIRALGVKKGIRDLKANQGPTVILKKDKGTPKPKPHANAKAKAKSKDKSAGNGEESKEIQDSQWANKAVRVVSEDCPVYLGRQGNVHKVHEKTTAAGEKTQELTVIEYLDKLNNASIFHVNAVFCQLTENDPKIKPLGFNLDWRKFQHNQRMQWAEDLNCKTNVDNLETIVSGDLSEASSIKAAFLELEVRFAENTTFRLFSPDVTVTFCDPEGLKLDQYGGNVQAFKDALFSKNDLVFAIYGEPPRHYTWLGLHKVSSLPPEWVVTYKDALKVPTEPNLEKARQLLKNLGFMEEAAKLAASNKDFQLDGWSCGIWDIKWTEHLLRKCRGEPVLPMATNLAIIARTNEFIAKVVEASNIAAKKTGAKPKPVSKAKAKAKPEPEFATFEEALTAAQECAKCIPTKKGTNKGSNSWGRISNTLNYSCMCCGPRSRECDSGQQNMYEYSLYIYIYIYIYYEPKAPRAAGNAWASGSRKFASNQHQTSGQPRHF